MLIELLVASLVAVPVPGTVDTTIAVEPDGRLELENFRGEVTVRTWDRAEVRVVADVEDMESLWIERTPRLLSVRTRMFRGPRSADFELTIPRAMALRIEGNDLEVDAEGLGGRVDVQVVNGDIRVQGGREYISLHAVHGEVEVTGAVGRVQVSSVNEDLTLSDIEGDIGAETTNGDIELIGIRSANVDVSTTNGDVEYDGTIRDGGRYRLTTHNGDIEVTIPESADATVHVATYQGDFEADYPVRLVGSIGSKEFTFTLGTGAARVELESFGGSIRVHGR